VIEILLTFILVGGRGTITSKEQTFVVLQLATNVALIVIINAMRSCNERTTLHCVESYLYYIILVNKKIFSEE
jgi:hypothetical protein